MHFYPKSLPWMENFPVKEVEEFWVSSLNNKGEPSRFSDVKIVEYSDLEQTMITHNLTKIKDLVSSLSMGSMLVIKNVLTEKNLLELNNNFIEFQQREVSSFHKIFDDTPNFWRDITEESSTNYAVPTVKKTSYWFPWNSESQLVYGLLTPIFRILKALGGKSPLEFESNIPSTGKIDRIQIVHYPPGSGKLDAHHDPKDAQRLIMSGYATKEGVDYQGGGFWALNSKDEKINLESYLNRGDFGTCYAEIVHGVDPTKSGYRGWIGLYTLDSDYETQRDTTRPATTA